MLKKQEMRIIQQAETFILTAVLGCSMLLGTGI
jgi:hypothetical protein